MHGKTTTLFPSVDKAKREDCEPFTMSEWSRKSSVRAVVSSAQQQQLDTNAERTAVICASLKTLYAKYVFPLEKKYNYDYFFESPFLSDVEFDGEWD